MRRSRSGHGNVSRARYSPAIPVPLCLPPPFPTAPTSRKCMHTKMYIYLCRNSKHEKLCKSRSLSELKSRNCRSYTTTVVADTDTKACYSRIKCKRSSIPHSWARPDTMRMCCFFPSVLLHNHQLGDYSRISFQPRAIRKRLKYRSLHLRCFYVF